MNRFVIVCDRASFPAFGTDDKPEWTPVAVFDRCFLHRAQGLAKDIGPSARVFEWFWRA